MTNLRELAESDLETTLENPDEWGLPVILVDGSTGAKQTVEGQILYDTVKINPDTGAEIIVHDPIVTLRRSTLSPVPASGEDWSVEIPITPSRTGATELFLMDRADEGGNSLGIIRLYLTKTKQSS